MIERLSGFQIAHVTDARVHDELWTRDPLVQFRPTGSGDRAAR